MGLKDSMKHLKERVAGAAKRHPEREPRQAEQGRTEPGVVGKYQEAAEERRDTEERGGGEGGRSA
ncbi:hypothetical protein [Streptomyces sp. XD-27]|uniref:hypothetical protein n=1 Tax=Streptomyces sp. XD-27 TaxID=3062779 RepID=UPI0026F47178|nr:hypothetical protein [Streptomyces sp. XD-27]WKX70103.1 hypothetical protein Q3Y56_09430 [Streptomyces sp. XD-27]